MARAMSSCPTAAFRTARDTLTSRFGCLDRKQYSSEGQRAFLRITLRSRASAYFLRKRCSRSKLQQAARRPGGPAGRRALAVAHTTEPLQNASSDRRMSVHIREAASALGESRGGATFADTAALHKSPGKLSTVAVSALPISGVAVTTLVMAMVMV